MAQMNNHSFHPSLLREYDIRGIIGETLFEEDAYWVGRCFGQIVQDQSGKAIAVGRDGRLSSPQLASALIQGLCEAGLDVYNVGVGPTPMLYFSEHSLPVDAAIMVTGSHNPPSHNGFKMSLHRKPFFGESIQALKAFKPCQNIKQHGKVYEKNLLLPYVERLLKDLDINPELVVVWDPGNGATVDALKALLQRLPGKHILVNDEMDGCFPSHPPDPSDPKNLVQLQQAVREHRCDVGIAFDGDGDRLAAIDSEGHILCGDQLLLFFAMDLLTRKADASILFDIKASQGIFDKVNSLGGKSILWKTGHSHIKAKMADSGALLGGEVSGHFFFKENYYGFDDGIYAALHLLSLLSRSSQTLAEFYEELPSFPSTPEIRISCASEKKFQIPQNIKDRLRSQGYDFNDIDGIRVYSQEGWWLLRASHTQDVLVARCEGYTPEGLEHVTQHLKDELAQEKVVFTP